MSLLLLFQPASGVVAPQRWVGMIPTRLTALPAAFTDSLTLTLGGTSLSMHAAVVEITGAAPGGGGSSVRIISSRVELNATSATVVNTASSPAAGDRNLAFASHRTAEVTDPRTNWTELSDSTGTTPPAGFETQWRSDQWEATASASWATASDGIVTSTQVLVADALSTISMSLLGEYHDDADASSYVTGSMAFKNARVYVAAFETSQTSGAPNTTTVSGGGLTWTAMFGLSYGTSNVRRITIWTGWLR